MVVFLYLVTGLFGCVVCAVFTISSFVFSFYFSFYIARYDVVCILVLILCISFFFRRIFFDRRFFRRINGLHFVVCVLCSVF